MFLDSFLCFGRTNKLNNDEKSIECAVTDKTESEFKVYKRRWLILGIFMLYSASNAFHWVQYSIIANIIMKYYDVDSSAVDWTSMVYMTIYIPLIFPASYFLDKHGLRNTAILGAFGTSLGTWIKIFSVHPDLFWVGMAGQIVASIAQVFVLSVPARLAAVWFGPDQVSSACSLGVFGNQFGVAVGFLLPPVFVKMHKNNDDIGSELSLMFYCMAAFTTVVFLIVILFFRDKPPSPPSVAAALATNQSVDLVEAQGEQATFLSSIKRLAVNPAYLLLFVSYGINIGVYNAISTLLNQIILKYNPGSETDAGRIGLVIVVAGMIGSVACGVILDATHKFKETILGLYISSLVAMIIYTFTLQEDIAVVYIVSGILGFFMTGYLPVGFELAAELTYPEPEGTSTGIIIASTQAFGIAFTIIYSWLFNTYSDLWANGVMCVMLGIGTVLTALIQSDMHRQKAQDIKNNTNTNIS